MKTLTVNMRVDLIAVISCGDLCAKQGIDPSGQPTSTTVRTALETVMELLRQTGQVPDYQEEGDEALVERYNELFKEKIQVIDDLDFTKLDQTFKNRRRDSKDRIAEIAGQVEQRLTSSPIPNVKRSTEETEVGEPPKAGFDLTEAEALSIEEITKISPKDRLLEEVQKGELGPLYEIALCVAYKIIPVEQWGTEYAQQIINNLVSAHLESDNG